MFRQSLLAMSLFAASPALAEEAKETNPNVTFTLVAPLSFLCADDHHDHSDHGDHEGHDHHCHPPELRFSADIHQHYGLGLHFEFDERFSAGAHIAPLELGEFGVEGGYTRRSFTVMGEFGNGHHGPEGSLSFIANARRFHVGGGPSFGEEGLNPRAFIGITLGSASLTAGLQHSDEGPQGVIAFTFSLGAEAPHPHPPHF